MRLLDRDLPEARVLDLVAGTGALGLEALSRGAAAADFVENHPSALHALKANVAAMRARERTRVFKRDAVPFVEALEEGVYDVVLADPPYGSVLAERVVRRWLEVAFARLDDLDLAPFAVEQPEVGRLRKLRPDRVAKGLLPDFRLEGLALQGERGFPRLQPFDYVGRVQREVHRQRAAGHGA
jgi:predicted RNA methylase